MRPRRHFKKMSLQSTKQSKSRNACHGEEGTEGTYKYFTDLKVPYEWWVNHYKADRRSFPPSWITTVAACFKEKTGSNVVCEFSRKLSSNYFPKKISLRKQGNKRTSKNAYAWTGYIQCNSRFCSRRYLFAVPQVDDDNGFLNIQVHTKGVYGLHEAENEEPDTFEPFLDGIEISASWWEQHLVQGNRKLTPGWLKEVSDRFREAKPAGVHCSLGADWNIVAQRKRNFAWKALTYCRGRPICSRKYLFIINQLSQTGPHILNVQVTGKHYHSKELVCRDSMSQSEKEKCYERLRAGMKPAQVSSLLKEQKASTECGRQDLENGNYDGVPSPSICRRLNKEVRARMRIDSTARDLAKACSALDKQYGGSGPKKMMVFTLSDDEPFQVTFSDPNVVEASATAANQLVFLDCTDEMDTADGSILGEDEEHDAIKLADGAAVAHHTDDSVTNKKISEAFSAWNSINTYVTNGLKAKPELFVPAVLKFFEQFEKARNVSENAVSLAMHTFNEPYTGARVSKKQRYSNVKKKQVSRKNTAVEKRNCGPLLNVNSTPEHGYAICISET